MIVERDVVPGVHRVADAFVNFCLVEDGDRVTVVDTGLPRSWDAFQQALSTIGRTPEDVAAVLLTHAHFDHVGFAERARRELGVPVYVHRADHSLVKRPKPFLYRFERPAPLYLWRPGVLRIFGQLTMAGAFGTKGVREVRELEDGAQLDVPGSPRVVHCPGHTHGHVAFHLPERDCLIAGDALVTLDPYTGRRGPRPVAKAATADSDLMWRSLDRLAGLDRAGTVLVGHGPPWTAGIAAAVEQARQAGQA